jgi:hypothetical protein
VADSDFKKLAIHFPTRPEWTRYSNGGAIGPDKYRPDMSFTDPNGKIICVIESSSTNDRKTGLGELLLAEKLFADQQVNGILIFSLCGRSTSPPTPSTQRKYIEPYFLFLRDGRNRGGVAAVFFIDEHAFELGGWAALDSRFLKHAQNLGTLDPEERGDVTVAQNCSHLKASTFQ